MERYIQLPKKLGKGSFASVALVQRKSDDKLFAAKLINLDSEEFVKEPYSNELRILERLDHPNIIKFYESFTTNDHLCLIMEYCEKGDLQQMIKEAKANGHHFSEDQILEWFSQLCLAVQYLHDNHIIHRDIKVHNIFVTSTGLIKLGDFGISKQLENSTDLSQTQTGTPLYLTPEMLMTSTSSYKSDIWMLGCLLHELCSLEKPFQGESFPQVVHQIIREKPSPVPEHYSQFMHDLLNTLLEKDPERRPSIYSLLTLPEIRNELCKLNAKYPEAYESLNLPTTDLDSIIEKAQGVASSENIDTSVSMPVMAIATRAKSFSLNIPTKPQQPNQSVTSPMTKESEIEAKSDPLYKSQSELKEESKVLHTPVVRKANNIWSMVNKKRSDNTDSPLVKDSNTSTPKKPEPSIKSKLHQDIASIANITFNHSKRTASDKNPLNKLYVNTTTNSSKNETKEKEVEGAKKTRKLSIKIPSTPEQGPLSESQVAPITQKSNGSRPGSTVSKISLNEFNQDQSAISSTKTANAKKGFSFTNLVFDNKSPKSPTRSMWVPQFLTKKLGKEKYDKVVEFLEHVNNPLELLKDQSQPVLDIIGEENRDCLIMLSFLMSNSSNSSTPTSTKETDISRDSDKIFARAQDGSRLSFIRTPQKSSIFSKGLFPSNLSSPNNKIFEGKK